MFENLGGSLKGMFGQLETAALPVVLSQVLAKTDLGNVDGLLAKLQQSGLGSQISSWLGNGPNQPITVEELRNALGNQQVQQMAQHFGIPTDKLLSLLSEKLPQAVDQMSPNGKVEAPKSA